MSVVDLADGSVIGVADFRGVRRPRSRVVDGALVGGASLKADSFLGIVKAAG